MPTEGGYRYSSVRVIDRDSAGICRVKHHRGTVIAWKARRWRIIDREWNRREQQWNYRVFPI